MSNRLIRLASVPSCACGVALVASAALAEPAPAPTPKNTPATTVAPVTVTARPRPSPKVIDEQAHSFVSVAAGANHASALDQIGRWKDAVCVEVTGMIPKQAAIIKARIESVAEAVDLPAPRPGCKADVKVIFTDRKPLRHPIQPFYGLQFGQNGLSHHFIPTITYTNVVLVADSKELEGKDLGQVADYMAMLVLSAPKSLDDCNSFASVLDLYAKEACRARDPPNGLTPADAAFLTALYQEDLEIEMNFERGDIARRMAQILVGADVVTKAGAQSASSPPANAKAQ